KVPRDTPASLHTSRMEIRSAPESSTTSSVARKMLLIVSSDRRLSFTDRAFPPVRTGSGLRAAPERLTDSPLPLITSASAASLSSIVSPCQRHQRQVYQFNWSQSAVSVQLRLETTRKIQYRIGFCIKNKIIKLP